MVKSVKKAACILLVMMFTAVIFCTATFAADGKTRVYDSAGLFSDSEELALQQKADSLSEKYSCEFIIVTASNLGSKTSQEYADDFYDQTDENGDYIFGLDSERSGVLYLIDMENKLQTICTTGKMIDKFSDADREAMFDETQSSLSSGSYYDAASSALDYEKKYSFGDGLTLLEILVAAVSGIAVALIIKKSVSNDYELKGSRYSYSPSINGKVTLRAKKDEFERETVVRRPIAPPVDTDHGGSSTHMGSSGTTHGGGSGSF